MARAPPRRHRGTEAKDAPKGHPMNPLEPITTGKTTAKPTAKAAPKPTATATATAMATEKTTEQAAAAPAQPPDEGELSPLLTAWDLAHPDLSDPEWRHLLDELAHPRTTRAFQRLADTKA